MWKNFVVRGRPQMAMWHMRTECWIPKATNTPSEYIIFIAFSTATMVARTRPNVTLCVHDLISLTFKRGDASNNRPAIAVEIHRHKNLLICQGTVTIVIIISILYGCEISLLIIRMGVLQNKAGTFRVTWHWGAFVQLLLQWKGNTWLLHIASVHL